MRFHWMDAQNTNHFIVEKLKYLVFKQAPRYLIEIENIKSFPQKRRGARARFRGRRRPYIHSSARAVALDVLSMLDVFKKFAVSKTR
jgi:hypothetical protein